MSNSPVIGQPFNFGPCFGIVETRSKKMSRTNRQKIGIISMCNMYYQLNDEIPLTQLSLLLSSYKIKCKKLFLSH
jgi:hypothetical protein